jgi:hypothetical protein
VYGRPRLIALLALGLAACTSGTAATPGPSGSISGSGSATAGTIPVDWFATGEDIDITRAGLTAVTRLAPAAELQGPHFAYAFVATATTSQVPAALADRLGLAPGAAPAPGHEIVIAEAGRWPHDDRSATDAAAQPADARIMIGSAVRISPVFRADLYGTVAMSVPTGVHPVLRVTDEGRRQSLDLRTGRRDRDAVAGYYPTRGGGWEHGAPREDEWVRLRLSGPGAAGLPSGSRSAGVFMTAVTVRLRPWAEEFGWAPPGRTWLLLEPAVAAAEAGTTSRAVDFSIAPGSFRVTASDGHGYTMTGHPITAGAFESETGMLAAAVPLTLRSITLRFVPSGSGSSASGAVTWSISGGAQTVSVPLR